MDIEGKSRVVVEPFRIEVLGGQFLVKELLVGQGEDQAGVNNTLHLSSPDRWLVMVVEGADPPVDALTIIDDELEFQSVALGIFETE